MESLEEAQGSDRLTRVRQYVLEHLDRARRVFPLRHEVERVNDWVARHAVLHASTHALEPVLDHRVAWGLGARLLVGLKGRHVVGEPMLGELRGSH
jgi:hypothetical protein